jgi:RNA polymerase sigma-70 factor, ECF subfamily
MKSFAATGTPKALGAAHGRYAIAANSRLTVRAISLEPFQMNCRVDGGTQTGPPDRPGESVMKAQLAPSMGAVTAGIVAVEGTGAQAHDDHGSSRLTFDVLYRLHKGPLLSYLLLATFGDQRLAEDITQETLFRAWRNFQHQTPDARRFRPWLYTVARRILFDVLRARKARPAEVFLTDLARLPAAEDEAERLLVGMMVRNGLMALKPEHRAVLIEVYYHGLSMEEAAQVLNIPLGTAKSRTFYALRALRKYVTA